MAKLDSAAIVSGRHVGTVRLWIENWCNAADRLLGKWEAWMIDFQALAIRADAEELLLAADLGGPIVADLQSLMAERKALLASQSVRSIQEILTDPTDDVQRLLSIRLNRLESRIGRLKKQCVSQWIACTQTSRFAEELLFIVRSGNRQPATYATNEQDAFQGGFVLDSTA